MKLPKPNEFGDYYLSRSTAIYPSKRCTNGTTVEHTGTYFVYLRGDVVFEGPDLKRFATPAAALTYIERNTERGVAL